MPNKHKLYKRYDNSIAFRYLSIATIFLMVLQLIISGIQNKRLYRQEVKRLQEKREKEAGFLSIISRNAFLSSDTATLKNLARETNRDRDVIYCLFVNRDSQVVAKDIKENLLLNRKILKTQNASITTQELIDRIKQDSTISEIRQPVVIGDRAIGEVRLAYSVLNLQQEIRILGLLDLAYATLIGILFATLTLIIFNKQIILPIQKIKQLAKEFAVGNLEQRITLKRKDEIGELGDALNSMASQFQYTLSNLEQVMDEALIAEKAKSRFLGKMSHELRTPLNGIIGFTQLMQQDCNTTKDQIESLNIIEQNSLHLLNSIDDVLEITKIESGKFSLNISRFDLHQLLSSLEQMFSFKAREKNLNLSFNIADNVPRFLENDEDNLKHIIANLLDNSIKFTNRGAIAVTVKQKSDVSQDSPHNLYFKITDTGRGISPTEIDNLFVAFAQTESGSHTSEGMGLGLPMSRQLIQLMGGEISIKSEVDRGTTIRFTIPITEIDVTDLNFPPSYDSNIASLEPDSIESQFFYSTDLSYDVTRRKLAVMPQEWLVELQESTIKVDNDLIFAVLERIPDRDRDLKQALMDLIENFRYDSILELTDDVLGRK